MKYLCTLLLLGLSLSTWAQQIDFVEYDLPNGLHVILHEDHSTPIVAVTVLYHVGSKNEDPQRTGFAHFFEHLMFEGSKHIDRGEYMKLVEGNGGELNANTSFDRTFYYELLPSNQLELGLWMEAERMLHANIDKIGVETQREVIKEEKRLRIDNQPYGSILEEIFKRAYTIHPYRWVPIGSMQYIDQATIEEFRDFYELYYVPNNATLSIAGDIDVAQAKAWIEKYYGDIPKGTDAIPRPKVMEPAMSKEVRDIVYDNVQLPGLVHGYRIPEQGTDDFYAVQMLSTLLSGGESSRFNRVLKDQKQLAMFTGAFPLSSEDPGLALMFGIANVGVDINKLEEALDEELAILRKDLISEREFQKLRNQVEDNYVGGKASIASLAEDLANYHVYFGDANLINTEIKRYMNVSREDIRSAAKKYFVPNNRVALHYLPKQ